ncbi:MAG: trypsin-like peptidase domain-containing protein [Mangrovibacterium sp.]
MNRKLLFSLLFFTLVINARGQLSQGGSPLNINHLKSVVVNDEVELILPVEKVAVEKHTELSGNQLKPFRFAHAIPVSLNPMNSGNWYEMEGIRVWQLRVTSPGAKSLNVIFDRFHLPDGARLFLYSADKSDVIGAFTSANNKASGKLATAPVAGDRLVIQYEEPVHAQFFGDLSVKSINHDYIGLKAVGNERRPLGESGDCNVNVNCDFTSDYKLASNSVCRVLVSGTDLCTGTLLNNARQDGTPYVYTAAHCIEDNTEASESVFLFNYESPYCGNIDGEVNNTLSGSLLRAESDSLDFSLVELTVSPPPIYRPYYLGWSNHTDIPDSSVCVHHPLGDIKKIAIDDDRPFIRTYSSDYLRNGFFMVANWENGTTEGGSSGAPLIDQNIRMVGSLTGGAATCEQPYNDYFARFSMAWDYYPDSGRQLKAWLDPLDSKIGFLDGYVPFTGEDLCGPFTNFTDEDTHENLVIRDNGVFKGYWGGSNAYGFTGFAEQFQFNSECEISGISLGVAKVDFDRRAANSKFSLEVYDGGERPGNLLHAQEYYLHDLEQGVMNYLSFHGPVKTNGKFFVSFSIEDFRNTDTLTVFLAKRVIDPKNTLFIKDGHEWYSYQEKSGTAEGSAILMEAMVCGLDSVDLDPNPKQATLAAKAYPNPLQAGQRLYVKFEEPVQPAEVGVFDMLGRLVEVSYTQPGERWMYFDFTGRRPGIYHIRVVGESPARNYQLRVLYVGDI